MCVGEQPLALSHWLLALCLAACGFFNLKIIRIISTITKNEKYLSGALLLLRADIRPALLGSGRLCGARAAISFRHWLLAFGL